MTLNKTDIFLMKLIFLIKMDSAPITYGNEQILINTFLYGYVI